MGDLIEFPRRDPEDGGTLVAVPEVTGVDRLTCFLYLLMRDELSTGKVARVHFETLRGTDKGKPEYSNEYLELYARGLAEKLIQPEDTESE